MADMMADWRLFGEHEQLKGVTLWWRAYAPRNEIWAQDQCAFCWATFARSGEEAWHEGYATQAPHGMGGGQESAPREPLADEEYISQVIAAVKATPRSDPPKSEPAPAPDATPDAALESAALEAIDLPSTPSEPAKVEQVYWVCPQCFEDFAAEFGWHVANEG